MRYAKIKGALVWPVKKYRYLPLIVATALVLSQAALPASRAFADENPEQPQILADNLDSFYGQISGSVYGDANSDGDRDADEGPLVGWIVRLLTLDTEYTLFAEAITDDEGLFVFDGLADGTYYVCQNLEHSWAQTQLSAPGLGIGAGADLTVGDTVATSQASVDEFCYSVELNSETPRSDALVFGNFQAEVPKEVIFQTGVRDDQDGEGEVLAATTGQVLAATGHPAYLQAALGLFLLGGSLVTARFVRKTT